MKCIEIIRLISSGLLTVSDAGASPPQIATPIIDDLKKYSKYIHALHRGVAPVESGWREGETMEVRISCPEVLKDGVCHKCSTCEKWATWPVYNGNEYEGLSGLCRSRRIDKSRQLTSGEIL